MERMARGPRDAVNGPHWNPPLTAGRVYIRPGPARGSLQPLAAGRASPAPGQASST